MKVLSLIILLLAISNIIYAQNDSVIVSGKNTVTTDTTNGVNQQIYHLKNGMTMIYPKPKNFGFITNLPKDGWQYVKGAFKKEAIKPWLMIAGATAILLPLDQPIREGLHNFSANIHYSRQNSYKTVWSIKTGSTETSLLKAPNNINSAIYELGQGYIGILAGTGLFVYGKIKNDYRARSTAGQLVEAFVLMGASTQLVKRISGRESPSEATVRGGKWQPFPSFHDYQTNTPKYDAFPSGHLATLMSTVTILAQNYPESRFIKPIGYSMVGLLGLAMINNDVHWASDYPLALGMGYLSAKTVANRSRKLLKSVGLNKHDRANLSVSMVRLNNRMIPGFLYTF